MFFLLAGFNLCIQPHLHSCIFLCKFFSNSSCHIFLNNLYPSFLKSFFLSVIVFFIVIVGSFSYAHFLNVPKPLAHFLFYLSVSYYILFKIFLFEWTPFFLYCLSLLANTLVHNSLHF